MSGTRLAFMRPVTTTIVNPITRRIAGWMPWFGIIRYRGRTSGRSYATPMNVFERDDGYVLALTYGADVDWVKNVIAAGGCELETRRRRLNLTDPRLVVDASCRPVPAFVRPFLRLLGVDTFMLLRRADPT
jgi:deazaflavin-dependent oxidoreductase (nitroreductase family)